MLFEADESEWLREKLVETQLLPRGISDRRVIDAFRSVPREAFVPEELAFRAYEDCALPIENGQTISQPYIVARTLQALELQGSERVLEVGTGSGYVAALLTFLAREVYSIERIDSLAETAKARLSALGYRVSLSCGDGTMGWADPAPYDAIAVAASGPKVPPELVHQLSPGGRLVIPLDEGGKQVLTRIVDRGRGTGAKAMHAEALEDVRFVPLIGREGVREG